MHYIKHLSKDPVLKPLLKKQEPFQLKKQKDLYLHLCFSIMSQQLSTKVASVIKKRFLELYEGKPSPAQILETPFEKLRGIGLSNAKVNYVQHVARFELEKGMGAAKLNKMSNEEIVDYLTEIKGVGRWTTEMLMMFALGREDVFAPDDLGIQQAMTGLYALRHRKKKLLLEKMNQISLAWSPYRTYACLLLWRWKDS